MNAINVANWIEHNFLSLQSAVGAAGPSCFPISSTYQNPKASNVRQGSRQSDRRCSPGGEMWNEGWNEGWNEQISKRTKRFWSQKEQRAKTLNIVTVEILPSWFVLLRLWVFHLCCDCWQVLIGNHFTAVHHFTLEGAAAPFNFKLVFVRPVGSAGKDLFTALSLHCFSFHL